MPNPPTPGQVAFAAYWRLIAPTLPPLEAQWEAAGSLVQAAWEAAAAAVAQRAVTDTLAVQRFLADAVRTVPPPEEEEPYA